MPLSGQQVTIGVLRDFESRLRYENGNCSWRLTVPGTAAEGLEGGTSPEILVGEQIQLMESFGNVL